MKRQVNLRFNPEIMATLSRLAVQLRISKTTVIERALECYAIKLQVIHPLTKYIGILSDKESKRILTIIKSSRRSKENHRMADLN